MIAGPPYLPAPADVLPAGGPARAWGRRPRRPGVRGPHLRSRRPIVRRPGELGSLLRRRAPLLWAGGRLPVGSYEEEIVIVRGRRPPPVAIGPRRVTVDADGSTGRAPGAGDGAAIRSDTAAQGHAGRCEGGARSG